MHFFKSKWVAFGLIFLSGAIGCSSNEPFFFPVGGINSGEGIEVNVNDVPGGDACEDNLYAVTYSDFDTRSDQNQVLLEDDGGGTWTGILPVSFGATDVTVYVYCDLSTGDQMYDDSISGLNTVDFSNTAQFNACDRDTGTPTQSNYSFSTFLYGLYATHTPFSGTTTSTYSNSNFPYSYYTAPYFKTGNNGSAAAGDSFAVRIANFGDTVDVGLTDLVALTTTAHPDEGGTLQQWCNCILAENVGGNVNTTTTLYTSTYTSSGFTYTSTFYRYFVTGYKYFTNVGFFTDTARTAGDNSGSCILP